ncbi:cytochrome-c peroxidase [Seongchinamella sediminis]|uniref:Cytochrome-c peroxidase n=1 Tax=Seongchinamella sediminis TaxID=2283635 RepID=A0A3L7E361_9GAMM|nr:cytochrome c peroxidase [Seongchinamella sediminis]RLQ23569.1 cytochrome-c peroxidase [Seongchinamella sediminis]
MLRRFILLVLLPLGCTVAAAQSAIVLNADCPPGFELSAGHCELRSLYQMYPSLQEAGVGGLKTGLPEYRDGFSPQQTDLGRYLFFDPVISRDGSVSCASCHHPDKGFADGLGRSVGIDDAVLPRSAPTLWNVAFLNSFFWDGRASSLEEQMQGPLYDKHEMGGDPQWLLATLNGIAAYRALFAQAFPADFTDGSAQIRLDQVYTALTAFQVSLVSLNSRYDQYAHGHADALTEVEKEGLNIFRSFVARCAECHTPPLFTNQQLAVIGTPEPAGMPFDAGAEPVLEEPSQRGAFKIPSLRNIELTAPYMHSGRFPTLREAAAFYTGGRGHAVPEGEELMIHWHIWEPNLTETELDRLVDFMKTLTDESFKPETPDRLPSGMRPVHDNIALAGEIQQDGATTHE